MGRRAEVIVLVHMYGLKEVSAEASNGPVRRLDDDGDVVFLWKVEDVDSADMLIRFIATDTTGEYDVLFMTADYFDEQGSHFWHTEYTMPVTVFPYVRATP